MVPKSSTINPAHLSRLISCCVLSLSHTHTTYALVILNSWPVLPNRLSLFRCQGSYSCSCFCLQPPHSTQAHMRAHKKLHFMNSHLSFKIHPGKPFQLHRQNWPLLPSCPHDMLHRYSTSHCVTNISLHVLLYARRWTIGGEKLCLSCHYMPASSMMLGSE